MIFNVEQFIQNQITKRQESLFKNDLEKCKDELFQEINNKSVLVIGGAGTIGSSFIKALLPYEPKSLTVVDYSENGLTELTRDLRSSFDEYVPSKYITYPFDFGSRTFEKLFRSTHYDIVASFAAHKHVRSEKDHLAIEAMFHNNVINTKKLLELATINKPNHLFCVSTDKAANPVNVMGASKKIMEDVLMAYSNDLKISTARFANVAFSNGSLLFGFNERISKRQPLSSPLDVKRYFVSPTESGQLCLIACLLGESGNILFPKLTADQMMTFSEIAERYLHELNLEPDYCESENEARQKSLAWDESNKKYPVYFFETNTSGEKHFEEFYTSSDLVRLNLFESLGVIQNKHCPSYEDMNSLINRFERLFESESIGKSDVINLLNEFLPEFDHVETGKGLDQKM